MRAKAETPICGNDWISTTDELSAYWRDCRGPAENCVKTGKYSWMGGVDCVIVHLVGVAKHSTFYFKNFDVEELTRQATIFVGRVG